LVNPRLGSKRRFRLAKAGSGEYQTFVTERVFVPRLSQSVGANVGKPAMLWNRPIGPKSEEAAILRRVMQEAIGNELRLQYEPRLELPGDLRRLVNEIDRE
jgi:hypothetical protein